MHVLMTLDAVGGVWRYAMDLAGGLRQQGFRFTFAGMGPEPSVAQREEALRHGDLVWLDTPLDWLVEDERALDTIPPALAALVAERQVDLVHLNLPSQAAGLVLPVPVLVVSHSCVVTWFAAVRGTAVPEAWQWQQRRNRAGFDNCDMVIAPSQSHADALARSYGAIANLRVVHNSVRPIPSATEKQPFVFAAARWWDDGKNAITLDAAAAHTTVPVIMAGDNRGPAGQYVPIAQADHRGQLAFTEVRSLLAEAAILCSPSLYEPFGLAPLEAAAARTALVLADIPTYRELWDGAAHFVAPHDAHGFAQAFDELARDEERRRELAAAAYQHSRTFTLTRQTKAMRDAYRDCLAHAPQLLRA